MAAPNPAVAHSNMRDLSFIALFALIFGSMMGSGVFDIPENVANKASVIGISLGWIITTIGILSLSWAFIYITNKRQDIQSGIYGYAKHGFGDYIGFNSAWGYSLNALLANASYLIYICATLGNFTVFKALGHGNTISSLCVESLLIWVVYWLIRRGIREAAILNALISAIKIVALVIIVLLFVMGFRWAQFKANFNLELHLGSIFEQVKSTMLVSVWDFTGIEAACIFALRAKHMQDVVKATLLGAIVVCVIDASISILPFGMLPAAQIRSLSTPSTAGILALLYGATSASIIRLAVIVSVAGALLTWTMLATNMFYLAAKDKTMPNYFAHINSNNVPVHALFISSVAVQLFVILAYFTNAVYLAMIQLATSLILLPYLFSTLFAMKLVIYQRRLDYLAGLKGILAVTYGIWLVYSGGLKFLVLSSVLYLIGSIFYFKARHDYGHKWLANKLELSIFGLLIIITLLALSQLRHWLLS